MSACVFGAVEEAPATLFNDTVCAPGEAVSVCIQSDIENRERHTHTHTRTHTHTHTHTHTSTLQTNADSCTTVTECKFGQIETQGACRCGPQGGGGGQSWMHRCHCVTSMSSRPPPPPALTPLHLPLILSTQRPRRGPIACASTAISASHSTANRRCACCGEAKKCVCVSRPKVDGVEKRR